LIVIKWNGAYLIREGKIEDRLEFPKEKAGEILASILEGDYSPIGDFLKRHQGEEIKIEGDLRDIETLRQVAIQLAKVKMRGAIREDYILVQILAAYDDIVSMLNLIKERIAEMEKIEEIRGNVLEEATLLRKGEERLREIRDELYKRIEEKAKEIAPNLSHIVGPLIAARLIHYAGGLKRLAMMPASTIQVLGAENVFFQHLKKGIPCPKHGVIFQVSEIRNSPKKLRGKIARALAGKIAIAARVDYYHGEFIGDRLQDEFKNRVEEIKNDPHRTRR